MSYLAWGTIPILFIAKWYNWDKDVDFGEAHIKWKVQ